MRAVRHTYRIRLTIYTLLDAKYRPEAVSGDVAGMRTATSGSLTDRLTREHRMTIDEARLILNVNKEDPMETILSVRLALSRGLPGVLSLCAPHTALRAPVQSEFASRRATKTTTRQEAEHAVLVTLPAVEGRARTRADRGREQGCGGRGEHPGAERGRAATTTPIAEPVIRIGARPTGLSCFLCHNLYPPFIG